MQNPFLLPDETYGRNLNMYVPYVNDATEYLSIMTGRPAAECEAWVRKETATGGQFQLVDPEVEYLVKETPGNRVKKTTTLFGYMRMVTQNRFILSPNLTGYTHPDDRESVLAQYIQGELNNRSANKALQHHHEYRGETLLGNIYKNRQQRNKIKCNSMSGAHGTTSSVLYNKSAHSTLTSICRSASSNTNANMERFLTGNRHYWSADIAITNIVNIVRRTDYALVQQAIDHFDLLYPTVADVVWTVKRCTDLYWRDPAMFVRIEALINKLTPIQRAAYLYTGDMFSLARLNDAPVRDFMTNLATVATVPVDNPEYHIKRLGEDERALIGILCADWIPPKKTIKDVEVIEGPYYGLIGATAKQITDVAVKYSLLVQAFWLTPNLPASMASFPESVRRTVVASDTDSSIFTEQDWVKWYCGKIQYDTLAFGVAAATTYLCSQITAHVLAIMSGNLGVAKQHLRILQMKNEFAFKMFSLTSMGKHYFASMVAKEGSVYNNPHWEIKGATLKNSKAPVDIMDGADDLIKHVGQTIMSGQKIKLKPILADIAEKEIKIRTSIELGEVQYFTTAQIKSADSYKTANSPYLQYTLWNEVFGPKYGVCPPPPYGAIKVSIDTDTATKFGEFLLSLEDTELADRFRVWLELNNKTELTTLYLPVALIQKAGIPKELIPRMNVRSMILGIMKAYYLILESLGYYLLNDNITRLVSDDYIDRPLALAPLDS